MAQLSRCMESQIAFEVLSMTRQSPFNIRPIFFIQNRSQQIEQSATNDFFWFKSEPLHVDTVGELTALIFIPIGHHSG
ncbi:hypothetical protein D3C72_1783330 [compost metagenome]